MIFYNKKGVFRMLDDKACLRDFGEFIRLGRESQCLSQNHVASLLGISQQYYSHIEVGRRSVNLVMAMKICETLKLNLSSFIHTYCKKNP
jgi:transcriptional regulator with XRE-family HTH domain